MNITILNYKSPYSTNTFTVQYPEMFKNGGGIHIKKKNRGKFTDYCGGKVTNECIRRAKASGNPTLVKRATFADNARKWKHKNGGQIQKFLLGGGGSKKMTPEQEADIFWKRNGKYIYDKFKAAGINKLVTAGLFGNISQESGFYPNARNGSHLGLVQNQPEFVSWIRNRYGGYDIDHQVQFLIDGLTGRLKVSAGDSTGNLLAKRFRDFNDSIKTVTSPEEVARLWEYHYEKSGKQGNPRRKKFAKIFHNGFNSGLYSYMMDQPLEDPYNDNLDSYNNNLNNYYG